MLAFALAFNTYSEVINIDSFASWLLCYGGWSELNLETERI